jgi:hypothetical protein
MRISTSCLGVPHQTVAHSAISINSRQAEPDGCCVQLARLAARPPAFVVVVVGQVVDGVDVAPRPTRVLVYRSRPIGGLEGQWSSGSRRSMNSVLAITDSNSAS